MCATEEFNDFVYFMKRDEEKEDRQRDGLADRSLNDKPIVPGRQNSRDTFTARLTPS